jgi:hypothetical protein
MSRSQSGGSPGQTTRQGKPARKLVIDPQTADWICKIFHWFITHKLSLSEFICRLNAENAPLPSRAAKSWKWNIVRRILLNTRYRIWWEYGRTKAVWMNKSSYSRKVEREESLANMQIEELRILDDATWYAAQEVCKVREILVPTPERGTRTVQLSWSTDPLAAVDAAMLLLNDRLETCPTNGQDFEPCAFFNSFPRSEAVR